MTITPLIEFNTLLLKHPPHAPPQEKVNYPASYFRNPETEEPRSLPRMFDIFRKGNFSFQV